MSYFKNVNIEQDVATTGATKTNLTGSQSYASSWFLVYNQSALQLVSLFDQNVLIYIDQAIDSGGTQIVKTTTIPSYANKGITRSVASVAPYYRVRLLNQSASASTGSMVSVMTAIFNPLPTDTDFNDNFRVASPTDIYGFEVENTPQGEMRTIEPFRLVGSQMDFQGNAGSPDPSYWTTNVQNSATVTVSNSLCSLASGVSNNAVAVLTSVRKARYVTGYSNRFRANIRNSTTYDNNTKRWGIGVYSNYTFTIPANTMVAGDVYSNPSGNYFTVMQATSGTSCYMYGTGAPTVASSTLTRVFGQGPAGPITYTAFSNVYTLSDGILFRVTGTTPVFSLQTYKNGSNTDITTFNGQLGSSYTLDTNIHTYEIYYSNTKAYLVIDGVLLHTISASTTGLTDTMHYGLYLDNINTGNTTTTTLGMRNAAIHRLGPEKTNTTNKNISGAAVTVCKYSIGKLHGICLNAPANKAIVIYDNVVAGGNTIATITPTNATGPLYMPLDCPFFNGLTVDTTAGAQNITIVYE